MEQSDQLTDLIHRVALSVLPILVAVIFHEVAHGVMALRLGDDTAQRSGRLTLNPLPHIDPIGTVLMPGLLMFAGAPVFGYARPVPVDYSQLRNPKRDMVWVALAGPGTNIALAVLSALAFHVLAAQLEGLTEQTASTFALSVVLPLAQMAQISVIVNVGLAIFNMLPLPPLDGGRVLTGILPYAQARLVAAIEPFGFMILIALIMTDSLGSLINRPIELLMRVLL
jgi:Zn-dependent protease